MKLVFCGDIVIHKGYDDIDTSKIFEDIRGFKNKNEIDFLIGNLEAPITENKKPIEKTGPANSIKPSHLNTLGIFDILTLSNNHINDFGESGVLDTIKNLDQHDIRYTGVGHNGIIKPLVVKKGYISSHIFSVSEQEFNYNNHGVGASVIDFIQLASAFKHIKKNSQDLIFVNYHGGTEGVDVPNPGFRKDCLLLVELGADLIVGHHTHCFSGKEIYKNVPIYYSLGNFIFDKKNVDESWYSGLVLSVEVDGNRNIVLTEKFVQHSVEFPGVKFISIKSENKLLERFNALSSIFLNEQTYLESWRRKSRDAFNGALPRLLLPFYFRGIGYIFRKTPLTRMFKLKGNMLYKLNLIRNKSHRTLLITHIESMKKK
jgi:calcineurin-like phosphoesterase